jgi:DNA polymerase (family 10)
MSRSRIPLGRAHQLASSVRREAARAGLSALELTPVAGLRRFAPAVEGAALLGVASPSQHPELLAALSHLPLIRSVMATTNATLRASTDRGLLELHLAAPDEAGASLVWHTGTRRHTTWLQQRAAALSLTFAAGRLCRADGSTVRTTTEQALYEALGLPFIPPEIREGEDEVEAGLSGRLPRLISTGDIRGDLHMHTRWSDGRDSIAEMARTAVQLGHAYIAVTDHSERSWSSRRLLAAEIALQRREVDEARTEVPGIDILHGVEVDIMPDGSLDFTDAELAGFDIVLASLHDAHGQSGARLTERCLAAIRHPLVNVLTHPANRSPGVSDGYELDFDRLFEAAVDTGTALEVDGSPGHLDMDGRLARRAASAGVTIVVNSDAHRADALPRQMAFGIGTARRGWVRPEHVLNTLEIQAVREFVARKRARGAAAHRPAG